jgi:hypothetical protein
VRGLDETGFRVQGRLYWVHCARTGKYTLLMAHPMRGTEAMKAMSVLASFAGPPSMRLDRNAMLRPWNTYLGPSLPMARP